MQLKINSNLRIFVLAKVTKIVLLKVYSMLNTYIYKGGGGQLGNLRVIFRDNLPE